jgi:hypothetical protein
MMWDADDFDGDQYGAVTSQAGHAAIIGMPFCALVLWLGFPIWAAPVIVAFAYFVLWEGVIQGFELFADSLMDTASVMAGASVLAGALHSLSTASICLLAWLVVMAIEWWRRA